MSKRKILYGYQMQNGTIVAREDEAQIVSRIFTAYLSGMSYQAVADVLNQDAVPFDGLGPGWDKHKVKRVLGDIRYMGQPPYPQIVDTTVFDETQELIQNKLDRRTVRPKSAADILWKKLRCGKCHAKVCRVGGGKQPDGTLLLRCGTCGMTLKMSVDTLLQEVQNRIMECGGESYSASQEEPTKAILQIQNAIARGLEHPERPEEIISLIFQGVSAQYENLKQDENALTEVDLRDFSQSILHIFLSDQMDVMVQFKD